ncbi:uncharacterized protein PODANS_1_1900 [Podospora anserina S mat+]|uniref:Podospora anserina S mat+ genomic DNA chromosome 1, supercontig 1 n=1 Tax=Podospora anserina (strain S / ATCC MYA-4624 / DSM 980 / FGSC 10383) TaxID=515849 RepID=B2A9V3_PODAN|nr:uncharacterized protein PODANS_1_1900 [Podospora anserina S mat+]CAP59863.1 unnamed protein product [Podospora anserina S mat+]
MFTRPFPSYSPCTPVAFCCMVNPHHCGLIGRQLETGCASAHHLVLFLFSFLSRLLLRTAAWPFYGVSTLSPAAYFKKFHEWGFEKKFNPILKDEKLQAREKVWHGFEDGWWVWKPEADIGEEAEGDDEAEGRSEGGSESENSSVEREEDDDGGESNCSGDDESGDSDEDEDEEGEEDGPGEVEQQLQRVQEHTNSLNSAPASGYGESSQTNTTAGAYHDHWNTVSNQPYCGGMRQWDNNYPLGYAPPVPTTPTLSTAAGWENQQQGSSFPSQPEQSQQQQDQSQQQEPRQTGSQPPDEAELAARREQRKRQIEAEAEELWRTKKRRRHTKQYGFLPPDPAGPPRYPSETTLTEAKEILQLDKAAYLGIREKFYNICMSHGVIKKTLMGPERWKQFKDRLIRESLHLRAAMWDQENIEQKKLAVEIICNDITKRVRITQTKVSVAEAKRLLGLDPDAGREIRAQLYNILAVERFGPVLEEGIERFRELRQRWIDANEVLKEAWTNQEDPEHARKVKAVIALGRDAERRYHADVHKRGIDPLRQRSPTPEPTKKPKPPKPPKPPKEPKEPKVPKKRGRPKKVVPSVEDPENEAASSNADAPLQPGMNQGQDWPIGGAVLSETPASTSAAASVVAHSVPGAPAAAPAPRPRGSRKNAVPAPAPVSAQAPEDPNMVPGLRLPAKNRRGRPSKQSEVQTHTQVHFAPRADAEPSPKDNDQALMDSQLGYGDGYVPDDTPEPYTDDEVPEVRAPAPPPQQQPEQIEPGFVGPLTLKQTQDQWLREQASRRQQEQAAAHAVAAAPSQQQAQNQARQNPQSQLQQQLGQPQIQQYQQPPFQPATPGQSQQGSLVASLRQMYHQPHQQQQAQMAAQRPRAQTATPVQQQPRIATPIQQPQPQMTAPPPAPPLTKGTFPVYFRLHSAIRGLFPGMRPQWIHLLSSRKYSDLKAAAVANTPGAMCYKIEGIVKDGSGGELPLPVTDDTELETYLEHVEGNGGGAPMFNVHLFPGGI